MALQDEILRATGGPTVNDGLFSWFGGATPGLDETLNDLELKWLQGQVGVTGTTIADCWDQYLTQLAITGGTLQDRLLRYWTGQP